MPLLTTNATRGTRGLTAPSSKVPAITAVFWILKLLTTAMGESVSDYLMHVNRYAGLGIGLVGIALTVCLQFRTRSYQPVVYWAAVAMVAVVGTMAADVLHVGLGVPWEWATVACAAALAVTFWAWRRTEGTPSIHGINSLRREVFYWLTVSFTFALGTAAGDLTATTLGLGFLGSIALFGVVMVVPVLGRWRFGLNDVVAFWFAYIVTRPLGASIADWLGKPNHAGGLGCGDGTVAAVLLLGFIALVTCVALRQHGNRTSTKETPK